MKASPTFRTRSQLSVLLSCSLMLAIVSGCGAPTREAKVANAILTLLTNAILGYATNGGDDLNITVNCGDGGADDGSFQYTVPASISDPTNLILHPDQGAALGVTFNKCVINTCKEKLVLDGGTATLDMGVTASELVSGAVPAAFTLTVQDQAATGVLEGTISYAYTIQANFTVGSRSSLKSIEVKDSTPAKPLTFEGYEYSASKILSLSDGC